MGAPDGAKYKKAALYELCAATAPDSGFRLPVYRNGTREIASLVQVESKGPDGSLATGNFNGSH
jgi:hypothetical protein